MTPGDVVVRTASTWVPKRAALDTYCALAERFGERQVFLLESAAGPVRDVQHQYVGFGELVTFSVTRGRVEVGGLPGPAGAVLRRITPMLCAEGDVLRLREPQQLWPVLQAVCSLFDADGSSGSFRFGFLAHLGYDVARYIEDLPYLIDEEPQLPDVHLALHQGCVTTDLVRNRSTLQVHSSDGWPELDLADLAALVTGVEHTPSSSAAAPPAASSDETTRAAYLSGVDRCHEYIAAGDIYQVQVGHEITMRSPLAPLEVYRRLRRRNASPYMYLTAVGRHTVIGASPELFVRVEDDLVTMRPIAGTVPRGALHDDVGARRLRSDAKELAEHTMLVDLCRNDIGRICLQDSLAVPDELVVERFSHVQHLVSTVVGRAGPGTDAFDVIAALFPAGTVTGTPKIRAMEIIEQLETSRRGLYAGAIGLLDVGGYVNLALCIRTVVHDGEVYRTRASAGVVVDSVAAGEWTETMAKAGAAFWAVTGQELL